MYIVCPIAIAIDAAIAIAIAEWLFGICGNSVREAVLYFIMHTRSQAQWLISCCFPSRGFVSVGTC